MEEINSKLIFDKISKDLMNSSVNIIYQGENEVDSNSKNNIVEQYKLLVDSSHKIEERRSSSNNVFIGINTILVSVLANSPQLIKIEVYYLPFIGDHSKPGGKVKFY